MPGPERTNKVCIMKTFRFDPDLIEDAERVLYLTGGKYTSMTNMIVVALGEVIKRERREIQQAGVVWEHLKPDFKNTIKEK